VLAASSPLEFAPQDEISVYAQILDDFSRLLYLSYILTTFRSGLLAKLLTNVEQSLVWRSVDGATCK